MQVYYKMKEKKKKEDHLGSNHQYNMAFSYPKTKKSEYCTAMFHVTLLIWNHYGL